MVYYITIIFTGEIKMNKDLYSYYILEHKHRELRVRVDRDLGAEYSALGLSAAERMTRRFEYLSSLETAHIIHR